MASEKILWCFICLWFLGTCPMVYDCQGKTGLCPWGLHWSRASRYLFSLHCTVPVPEVASLKGRQQWRELGPKEGSWTLSLQRFWQFSQRVFFRLYFKGKGEKKSIFHILKNEQVFLLLLLEKHFFTGFFLAETISSWSLGFHKKL